MDALPLSPIRTVDNAAIFRAAQCLRQGGLVAFPTETVYGLGADATNDQAVAGIFEVKGRPRFNPLIVHVLGTPEAERLVEFSWLAEKLAEGFWPGPLTLVLPRKPDCPISLLASAGLETVAVRSPTHPVARQLLAATSRPLAAPSANRSGRVSPTTADHVLQEFGEDVDVLLDGGATWLGMESTVIGFECDRAVLLRPGAVSRDEISEAIGTDLAASTQNRTGSPGQLKSHYAPQTQLRLNAHDIAVDEALLAFGPNVPAGANIVRNLSATADLKEAAANLFSMLRDLDRSGAARIAVVPIPTYGLGEAINDRLARAAAPRNGL